MVTNGFKLKMYIIAILCGMLCFVLIIIAMGIYPGGYQFFNMPLSDLGKVRVDGQSNLICLILFTIAFLLLILANSILFIGFPQLFSDKEQLRKISNKGSRYGFIENIFVIAVLCTPVDIFTNPHVLFAILLFIFLLIHSINYHKAIKISNQFSKIISILYGTVIISNAILLGLTFISLVPGVDEITILWITWVIAQKMTVFVHIGLTIYLSLQLHRLNEKN